MAPSTSTKRSAAVASGSSGPPSRKRNQDSPKCDTCSFWRESEELTHLTHAPTCDQPKGQLHLDLSEHRDICLVYWLSTLHVEGCEAGTANEFVTSRLGRAPEFAKCRRCGTQPAKRPCSWTKRFDKLGCPVLQIHSGLPTTTMEQFTEAVQSFFRTSATQGRSYGDIVAAQARGGSPRPSTSSSSTSRPSSSASPYSHHQSQVFSLPAPSHPISPPPLSPLGTRPSSSSSISSSRPPLNPTASSTSSSSLFDHLQLSDASLYQLDTTLQTLNGCRLPSVPPSTHRVPLATIPPSQQLFVAIATKLGESHRAVRHAQNEGVIPPPLRDLSVNYDGFQGRYGEFVTRLPYNHPASGVFRRAVGVANNLRTEGVARGLRDYRLLSDIHEYSIEVSLGLNLAGERDTHFLGALEPVSARSGGANVEAFERRFPACELLYPVARLAFNLRIPRETLERDFLPAYFAALDGLPTPPNVYGASRSSSRTEPSTSQSLDIRRLRLLMSSLHLDYYLYWTQLSFTWGRMTEEMRWEQKSLWRPGSDRMWDADGKVAELRDRILVDEALLCLGDLAFDALSDSNHYLSSKRFLFNATMTSNRLPDLSFFAPHSVQPLPSTPSDPYGQTSGSGSGGVRFQLPPLAPPDEPFNSVMQALEMERKRDRLRAPCQAGLNCEVAWGMLEGRPGILTQNEIEEFHSQCVPLQPQEPVPVNRIVTGALLNIDDFSWNAVHRH